MMAEEHWAAAVEDGLRLSKRIYFGKDRAVAPPKPLTGMEKLASASPMAYLPTAAMMYAVIGDPAIVDNPDIPSYQPHVHGRCDPPALIPLQMNGISLEVDCYLDTAFVTLSGSWRIHCVMGSKCCDVRVAIPMGEEGSILGIEVEVPRKSYSTQLVALDGKVDSEKRAKVDDGGFLKPHIFTFTVPQVDGGSNLSIKVRWSQKLLYHDGQLTLTMPFSFPEYVTPAGKNISKKEKIQLNLNSGPGTEILLKTSSHPLKELRRQVGSSGFFYDSEVLTWSNNDFIFAFAVSSSPIFGGVLLQSPSALDVDQREMFCLYLFPGNDQRRKVFRKHVVFVVDISGSMRGKPLEDTKNALSTALSKLDPEDSFSLIAFNDETYLFSSSPELASKNAIENVTHWISMNFVPGGGTNILLPLNQAMEMLSESQNSLPIILLITDGAVENDRDICDIVKGRQKDQESFSPRIYTLGIGSFCNHYFLQMLAIIGRGHHIAALDPESIETQIERLFARASSTIIADLAFDSLDGLDDLEVYPSCIPDLSSASPLIVSGRYRGSFPDTLKVNGITADGSNFSVELKVEDGKDIPLDRVLAKQQIELITSNAWLSQSTELEEKITKISRHNCIISEYTHMIMLETQMEKKATELAGRQKGASDKAEKIDGSKSQMTIVLRNHGVGFGNLTATAENIPPGSDAEKPMETAEKLVMAASNCCGRLCDHCCCMCCIDTCSEINDQCAIVLTQFCGALACLGCFACCELCCSGQDR